MKRKCTLLILCLLSAIANAQLLSGNAFLKGDYVEVGIAPKGYFGTTINAPSGYHTRSGGPLGFIADPAKDGWNVGTPDFCGDYFLPGTPEEGWSVHFNGTTYSNNGAGPTDIDGHIISSSDDGATVQAIWQGTKNGVEITAKTYFPKNALYFVTEVTIKNTTSSAISNVYYMRNVDPDQEASMGGPYETDNSINQQNPNSINTALVTATGLNYGCFLGLGARDCRARVTYGGFTNRSPIDVWNGVGLNTSGSQTADEAISIAFKIGDLAPGQSTKVAYAYVLSASQLDLALGSTVTGFQTTNGSSINTGTTINSCLNTSFPLKIENGDAYSWNWSPATGLNTTEGNSVIATLTGATPITYTATGTGICGTLSVELTLTATIPELLLSTSASPPALCSGTGSSTISATLSGGTLPYSYAWNEELGIGQFKTVSPAATKTYTVTATDKNGCSKSGDVTVLVGSLPSPTITPATPLTVCSGTTITLNGSSTGSTSPSYAWSSSPTGFSSDQQNPTFTMPTVASVTDYTLTLTVTEGSCSAATTKLLTVNPIPNAVATPASQTICSGSAITPIAFTGNAAGTVYNWTRDNTEAVTGIGSSGSGNISGSLSNTTNAPVTVTFTITPAYTNAGTTCTGLPITATVTVNPVPNAVAVSASQIICSASAITAIVPSGNVTGTVYNWGRDNTANVIGIATNGSGNISGSLSNTTNAPVTVTFTITPAYTNAGTTCTGLPITATVTVNPVPNAVATPSAQTICSNTAISPMIFTGNVAGTVYSWTRDNTATVIGINSSGSGEISGTMSNTTNAPIPVTFTITPSFTNVGTTCNGTPMTATVMVKPLPLAMISGTNTVCQNDLAPSITFTGRVGTSPYKFTYHINDGPHQTITTDVGNSVNAAVPTGIAGLFVYTLVSVEESGVPQCSQTQSGSATVTVKPTPTSALTASQVDVCPNTQVTLDAHCSIPTATANWNPGAPTVTPNAPTTPYVYKASCTFNGCTGNESSVEVRTHRILADLKNVAEGTLPQPIPGAVKDNLAPTNVITAPNHIRRWTVLAKGCAASEAAVFKLSGPVNFSSIDNDAGYALFSNEGSNFYSIDHPNYGTGGSFPNGTYTLTIDLRDRDGAGGPFPKNRVATGNLLATRTLQFTVSEGGQNGREGIADNKASAENELNEVQWLSLGQNPVSTEVVVCLSGRIGQSIELSLMNLQGQPVQQRTVVLNAVQQYEVLNVEKAAEGLYLLKAVKDNQVKTLKVMKRQ